MFSIVVNGMWRRYNNGERPSYYFEGRIDADITKVIIVGKLEFIVFDER